MSTISRTRPACRRRHGYIVWAKGALGGWTWPCCGSCYGKMPYPPANDSYPGHARELARAARIAKQERA